MQIINLIEKKRDGGELSTAEINWFIAGYTADHIPDYQIAALLMAIYLRGMTRRETSDLTQAIVRSGEQLDLHDVVPFVVDKHSSGGVGDKTSLVVLPLVSACGVPVGKMSGRGLGSSGGTLDKMESFTGWHSQLSLRQFKQQLADIGLVLAGQTGELAPADGKLYSLRDVTGTVANKSLIAASIMSKKLAAGADAIVLDVKMGNGAFMRSLPTAQELGHLMVEIGQDAGRKVVALISDMNQPLGAAVGNVLEVKEALATLRGEGPADLWQHCQLIAAYMVWLAGKAATLAEAEVLVTAVQQNGTARHKFRQLVAAQGGNPTQVDNPDTFPQAKFVTPVTAVRSGYLATVDTAAIGWAVVNLGGGRLVKSDLIDPAVGFIIPVKIGDYVPVGAVWATIHANDPDKLQTARQALETAVTWSDTPVPRLPHIYDVIT